MAEAQRGEVEPRAGETRLEMRVAVRAFPEALDRAGQVERPEHGERAVAGELLLEAAVEQRLVRVAEADGHQRPVVGVVAVDAGGEPLDRAGDDVRVEQPRRERGRCVGT